MQNAARNETIRQTKILKILTNKNVEMVSRKKTKRNEAQEMSLSILQVCEGSPPLYITEGTLLGQQQDPSTNLGLVICYSMTVL